MGGNAFKASDGTNLTTEIRLNDVKVTLDHFLKAILNPLGIKEYKALGSTGKKKLSGDMDVAVSTQGVERNQFKKDFVTDAKKILDSSRVRTVGQIAMIMYPIISSQTGKMTDESVQSDVMFTEDIENTGWMMSGSGDGAVKGVYRNLMFAYLAKSKSVAQQEAGNDIKMTISFPGGLQIKRDKKIVLKRTNEPAKVLKLIDILTEPSNVTTFEALVDYMVTVPKLKRLLSGYKEYIQAYVDKDPDNSGNALKYIRQKIGVSESLRHLIQLILKD